MLRTFPPASMDPKGTAESGKMAGEAGSRWENVGRKVVKLGRKGEDWGSEALGGDRLAAMIHAGSSPLLSSPLQ